MLALGLKDEKDVARRRGTGIPGGRNGKESHCGVSCVSPEWLDYFKSRRQ